MKCECELTIIFKFNNHFFSLAPNILIKNMVPYFESAL